MIMMLVVIGVAGYIGFFWRRSPRLDRLARSTKAPTKQFDPTMVYTCEALHVHNVTSLHSGGCCEYCHANPKALIMARVVASDQHFMAEMCCRTYHDLTVTGRIGEDS